jgi:hypothetical protein
MEEIMSRMHTKSLVLAGLVAAAVLAAPHNAEAKNSNAAAAAIVGGVAGLAVGAAIADANRHKPRRYGYDGYAAPYGASSYDPYFQRAFRPSPGIECYPAQRLCYNDNGSVANKWTRRVFGY